ncbi:MAG: bifunctional oligoribonuclease/PAP phosphatase NrnA [Desulfatirhabdiaceae bacterium]
MDQIINHLNNGDHILVATHTDPDGDAIGSLIAIGLALTNLGKHVLFYNESPIPAVYRFLPGVSHVKNQLDPDGVYDTAVVVDCGDIGRVGMIADRILRIPVLINIDHHVTNTNFGTCQWLDFEACASAEIVFRLIEAMHIPISTDIATCIYTGILTDTGSFRFSNTNRAAFEICEKMITYGVNPFQVAQHVYGTYSLGRIKLLNRALDSIEISKNGKVSMMSVTRAMLEETGTQPEDADGLINYAKRIQDVQVAVLIQEQIPNGSENRNNGHTYHVSLRSDGTVDVAAIAATFGGGGHVSAAGFTIKSSLSDVKNRICQLTECQ